ncbi:galactosylceramide sulfotransferase-like isoform X2 [Portunus trituberculatus]|uniref:galactosylceramide sulfotransferase-like isoform X2 n=1 Tax=Portunus trituberculatus TaxID=210409 RepID=UPI001E1CD0E8|nr:galactosylceramide sulfotransferase-like isoform X2 [Portunus trituberculatus]
MRSEVMSESVKNVVEGEQSGAGRRWAMSMLRCPVLRFRACRLPFKSLVVSLVALLLVYGALLMDQAQSPGKPSWLEFKTCSPRNNIAFLKTHKCASSAIQNILLRYGDNHDLNFALPNVANYFGSGRRIFEAGMVWSSPFNKVTPNIFAIHTKWNYEEVKKVMPEDTVYFTIVREPMALFRSLFDYSNIGEKAGGLTLDEYVKQNPIDTKRTLGYLGYNQMTWDLGTPLQDMSNLTVAHELVQRTDAQFGLVLVAERMDESLVLLAKYLCWELRDVLVLKVNSLRDEFKSSISEESRKALQQRLAPDYLLYNHFLERFDQQVEAFGRRRMAAEVARLRELMALLVTTCNFVRKEASDLTGRQKPWSNKVDGFQVGETAGGCAPYAFGELYFLDVLRKKQQKYIAKKFGLPPGPPMGAIPLGAQEIKELNPKRAQRFPSDEKRKGGKLSTVRGQG